MVNKSNTTKDAMLIDLKEEIKNDCEAFKSTKTTQVEHPTKHTKHEIEELVRSGEAAETDGDAEFIIRGFDDSTIFAELHRRYYDNLYFRQDIERRVSR